MSNYNQLKQTTPQTDGFLNVKIKRFAKEFFYDIIKCIRDNGNRENELVIYRM